MTLSKKKKMTRTRSTAVAGEYTSSCLSRTRRTVAAGEPPEPRRGRVTRSYKEKHCSSDSLKLLSPLPMIRKRRARPLQIKEKGKAKGKTSQAVAAEYKPTKNAKPLQIREKGKANVEPSQAEDSVDTSATGANAETSKASQSFPEGKSNTPKFIAILACTNDDIINGRAEELKWRLERLPGVIVDIEHTSQGGAFEVTYDNSGIIYSFKTKATPIKQMEDYFMQMLTDDIVTIVGP